MPGELARESTREQRVRAVYWLQQATHALVAVEESLDAIGRRDYASRAAGLRSLATELRRDVRASG